MNPPRFIAKLRRDVYEAAVACAVTSWLILQATSLFCAAVEALPSARNALFIAVAFGFPVALVLALAFELTPDEIEQTEAGGIW